MPGALGTAWDRLREGYHHLGESPAAARRRMFGVPYAEAIEGFRQAIPPDDVYVLINADDRDEGDPIWVRFDLAPRRALFLGRLGKLPHNIHRAFPRGPHPVILTFGPGNDPPRLIARDEFLAWLETLGRPAAAGGSVARPR